VWNALTCRLLEQHRRRFGAKQVAYAAAYMVKAVLSRKRYAYVRQPRARWLTFGMTAVSQHVRCFGAAYAASGEMRGSGTKMHKPCFAVGGNV
jgi:hypothetical protein